MSMRRAVVGSVLVAFVAALAAAQSLGERAREARKKERPAGPPARAFSNDDLNRVRPRPTPAADGGEPAPPVSFDAPDDTSLPDPVAQRQQWQARAREVRDKVTAARQRVAELQAKLDALRSPFHPTTPYGIGNPDVAPVETSLAEAKAALAEAEKERAQFEADAARIPSHWTQPEEGREERRSPPQRTPAAD
jgi:hypothetical protein